VRHHVEPPSVPLQHQQHHDRPVQLLTANAATGLPQPRDETSLCTNPAEMHYDRSAVRFPSPFSLWFSWLLMITVASKVKGLWYDESIHGVYSLWGRRQGEDVAEMLEGVHFSFLTASLPL